MDVVPVPAAAAAATDDGGAVDGGGTRRGKMANNKQMSDGCAEYERARPPCELRSRAWLCIAVLRGASRRRTFT